MPHLSAARRRLPARRPGPLGTALLVPTWVLLGGALVVYVVAMLALAFAAVAVATLRLVLTPPLRALRRAVAGAAPGARRAPAGAAPPA